MLRISRGSSGRPASPATMPRATAAPVAKCRALPDRVHSETASVGRPRNRPSIAAARGRKNTESPLPEECRLSGDDDEKEAFRKAMRGVRPLAAVARASPPRRRPPPRARFSRAERAAVLRESLGPPDPQLDIQPGDSLHFRRQGVPETVLRRLRRGDYRIESEIDLHGLTEPDARAQLR